MSHAIKITFPKGSELNRLRNFAEELSLSLGMLGQLPMDDADAATTQVVISDIPTRGLGDCEKLLRRLLKKHHMTDEVKVARI